MIPTSSIRFIIIVLGVAIIAGCGDDRRATAAATATAPSPIEPPTQPTQPTQPTTTPPPPTPPAATGVDFTAAALVVFRVAACGGDAPLPAGVTAAVVDAHCRRLDADQAELRAEWVDPARAFFATLVPRDVPRTVVYPFAGGDLHTALTVFPDADEITTLSLEPAGDPRSLTALAARSPGDFGRELTRIGGELRFLYRVSFSNTMNLIDAMRGGKLPGQLIFSLAALRLHGLTPVGLRYFRLEPDGAIHYLDDADVARIGGPDKVSATLRNRGFANLELRYVRPGDDRVRIYRHIEANLDDAHHGRDGRVLAHLAAKGKVAIMTKAASYLLSFDTFSKTRGYVASHLAWMVSDASGIPPAMATAAGLEQTTYGRFETSHMKAGRRVEAAWKARFAAQPERPLGFRFGYYDGRGRDHLVVTRPAPTPPPN